ncbi:MAG: hypothetical protein MI866_03185, partial [Bacteroidales bacterium]|nr:hypothetical protein [Bacteroidales bacterium]
MKDQIKKQLIAAFSILILILINTYSYGQINPVKKVLVLHSYHQGLEWTDNVTDGIKQTMLSHEDEVDLYFEYLDSKRYPDSLHFSQ